MLFLMHEGYYEPKINYMSPYSKLKFRHNFWKKYVDFITDCGGYNLI